MTHKTITDHNRLDGSLAIAHHPDTFLSEEVTTYFPDGCKIHLLVWNLTEAQHGEIERLRPNIFELAAYLRQQDLPPWRGAPAHQRQPGADRRACGEARAALPCLRGRATATASRLRRMCWGSAWPRSRRKRSPSLRTGMTWCQRMRTRNARFSSPRRTIIAACIPVARSRRCRRVRPWPISLRGLLRGEATLHGPAGDPLTLSSSLYTTVFSFARDKIRRSAPVSAGLIGKMAGRFLAGQNPTAFSFAERFDQLRESLRTGQALDFVKPGEITLTREIGAFVADPKLKRALDRIIAEEPNAQRRSFRMASHIANELTYRLITQFQKRINKGNLVDAFQTATGLLPVGLGIVPYVVAFGQQAPDRRLLAEVARDFTGGVPPALAQRKAGLVHRHARGRQRRRAYDPRDGPSGARRGGRPDRGDLALEARDRRHPDQELPARGRV